MPYSICSVLVEEIYNYSDENPSQHRREFESSGLDDAQDSQSEVEEEYESSDSSEQYEDAENLERYVQIFVALA